MNGDWIQINKTMFFDCGDYFYKCYNDDGELFGNIEISEHDFEFHMTNEQGVDSLYYKQFKDIIEFMSKIREEIGVKKRNKK